MLFLYDADYFFIFSFIDLAVNYYGWSAKEIVDYFNKESMMYSFEKEQAQSFIETLIELPGAYCPYGLGCTEFMTLCNYARKTLGDKFDYVSYHETLMKNGPLPFNILKEAVDEYIEAKQN